MFLEHNFCWVNTVHNITEIFLWYPFALYLILLQSQRNKEILKKDLICDFTFVKFMAFKVN